MFSRQQNITIDGEPIPRIRPRIFNNRGKTMSFDPQHEKKRSFILKLHETFGKAIDLTQDERYSVCLKFYMLIPKSVSKRKCVRLKENPYYLHPHSCDLDNLIKFVLDCGNKILWSDDRHITMLTCEKLYSENPRTEISLTVFKHEDID